MGRPSAPTTGGVDGVIRLWDADDGTLLAELGRNEAAIDAYSRGIVVAGQKGDRQAVKEMTVFRRRLQKKPGRE